MTHEMKSQDGIKTEEQRIPFNNIEMKRRFLQNTLTKQRFIQEFKIQKTDVSKSKDWYFGVSFLGSKDTTLFEIAEKESFIDTYESIHDFKSLMTVRLVQYKQSLSVMIIPQNFMLIWVKIGGFLAITTRAVNFIVAGYQQFSFQKAAIKKMYLYSKTKSSGCHDDSIKVQSDAETLDSKPPEPKKAKFNDDTFFTDGDPQAD